MKKPPSQPTLISYTLFLDASTDRAVKLEARANCISRADVVRAILRAHYLTRQLSTGDPQ